MLFPDISCNPEPQLALDCIGETFAAYRAAGVKSLTLLPAHLQKFQQETAYRQEFIRQAEQNALALRDAHAPHGVAQSLGNRTANGNEICFNSLREALETVADLGTRTLTVHTGRTRLVGTFAPDSGEVPYADLPSAMDRAKAVLEKILPLAERYSVVIAVENLFLPSGCADFVTELVTYFNHKNLGLCYDSGHALLLEKIPGKSSADIAQWIRCGWDDDTVVFQDDQLDRMLSQVVTTHLHDNHGFDDEHLPPGEGIIDWQSVADRLSRAPRLMTLQCEVANCHYADIGATFPKWFGEFKK